MNGNFKHNLSQGASVIQVEDENFKIKLREIAVKAINEIGQDVGADIAEIEVNSGVTINKYTEFVSNGREVAKEIYGEVIEKMLN